MLRGEKVDAKLQLREKVRRLEQLLGRASTVNFSYAIGPNGALITERSGEDPIQQYPT